ncbi:MAG: murein L,D-transpeptidase catalytic domain family protein [Gammaproteobacteria bacterium]|nr:murein L,D-transpeptidase catalytic domain family protein [Gammaproteobacteria bacterium]
MNKIFRIIIIISSLVISQNLLAASTISTDDFVNIFCKQTDSLKPNVVKLALEAFNNAKHFGIHPKKQLLTIIDYTLPSTQKRFWVLDLTSQRVLFSSLVAHGRGSGLNYTNHFSNSSGSHETSIGLFLTENTYFGHDGYSLTLNGLDNGFNDKAKSRRIVLHGAPYVSNQFAAIARRIGRSWGCPAIQKELAEPVINTIKGGTLIFAYYPEQDWLQKSKYLRNYPVT